MTAITAQDVIDRLGLEPHPVEGGYFRETYRAAETVPAATLDSAYAGEQSRHGEACARHCHAEDSPSSERAST